VPFRPAIRYAEPSDKEAIKQICRVSFDRLYGYFADLSLNSSNHVLVSDVGGTVVGFVQLKLIHIHNDILGNIQWLAVHPEYRRKGIASALIDTSIEYFRNHGIDDVYVSVRRNNLLAQNLFQSKGFMKVGINSVRKFYGRKVVEFYLKMRIVPNEIVLVKTHLLQTT